MTSEAVWESALRRLEGIMTRVEALLGKREQPPTDATIFQSHLAFRWERAGEGAGRIVPIPHTHRVDLADSSASTRRRRSCSGTRNSSLPGGERTTFFCGGSAVRGNRRA